MTEIVGIDKAYEDLANAIVLRAIEDYKDVVIGIRNKNTSKYCNEKKLMTFFTSAWFEELCAIDSESFLEMINKLMYKYRLTHDVVKEKGGTRYYVCDAKDHSIILDGPFKKKTKALHRAAEMQEIEFTEYAKVRRCAYRADDKQD